VGSVSGGGAGFAIAISTTAAFAASLPYGRIAVTRTTYGLVPLNGASIRTCSLPTAATGDTVIGATIASHSIPQQSSNYIITNNFRPFDPMPILNQGTIVLEAEVAIGAYDTLFYRHTANGALNKIGAVAPAAGTGLLALPAPFTVFGPSQTMPDGLIGVPVTLNYA
jgi:hypothetical protein